jgi:glycosyltransferase involved in cell wall biosynthesis
VPRCDRCPVVPGIACAFESAPGLCSKMAAGDPGLSREAVARSGIAPDRRGLDPRASPASPAPSPATRRRPLDFEDPRLRLIRDCPDRAPDPSGGPAHPRDLSDGAGCRAGRGAVAGRVTLRECLDCAAAGGPVDRRYPFDKDVLIRCALTSWTGYGQIGHWLGRGLESLGLGVGYANTGTDPRYLPRDPWVARRCVPARTDAPWSILLGIPHEPPAAGRVARFTMWETTRIGRAAVARLNASPLVCVPCEANRRWFRESGVGAPISVVPMGVGPGEGYRDDETPPPSDVRRFGMAGRMAHGASRKGLNEGMEAFVAAFPRSVTDVELVVKVWPDCLAWLRAPDDPRIRVVTDPMRPSEMADWYRSLTALLVPSKGEGWGLHTHQAMAVGRPVIAAPWGGTADFWDDRCGWALEYDLAPAGDFFEGLGDWAVPRLDSMVECLRRAYSDPEAAVAKGRAAARRAAEFSWDRTARALHRALSEAGLLEAIGRPPAGSGGSDSAIPTRPDAEGEMPREADPPPIGGPASGDAPASPGPHHARQRHAPEPGGSPEIPIAIMTAARPVSYIDRTLASLGPHRPVTLMVGTPEVTYLERHRGDPRCRIVAPGPGEYSRVEGTGVWQHAAWNYWRCLGAHGGSRRLLILEDDVRCAIGWEERLGAIVRRIERDHRDYILSLYYPHRRVEGAAARFVDYPAGWFYGTQGVLFAGRARAEFRRYLREWGIEGWVKPYDLLLGDYAAALEIPCFATMPSLVQHIGEVTTGQSAGFHRTECFDEVVEGP